MGRKVKEYSRTWNKRANIVAKNYCPPIHSCKRCHNPVIQGYCCTWCGDADPSNEEEPELVKVEEYEIR